MTRRVLIPPTLPATLPIGGGQLARPIHDFNGTTMGTYWRARVVAPIDVSPAALIAAITEALAVVVNAMSPWEPHSDLSRFRDTAPEQWITVSPHTFKVLARALDLAALTEGRYDPTIGRLTDALGFGPSGLAQASLPDSPRAAIARQSTNFTKVQLDPTHASVLQPGGMQLDLCSIAKGYAVDLALEKLQALGVSAAFLEIGGEARGIGCKPDGQPWWCTIEPPPIPNHGLAELVAAASPLAVATSGNTYRPHIISPRLDAPIDPHLVTVTVLASTCMEADVWATALFVLGTQAGLALAREHHVAALFVEHSPGEGCRESVSSAFAEFTA
jgi:thiamine biosynthesis lipoprotein